MHRAIRIWAAVLILGQPGLALSQAPEQTIFGPKLYDHPTSDKSRTVDTVTVPAFIAGPFTLRIRNGDDRDGVHNASVFLNGARILRKKDFDAKTHELVRTLQLQPENQLVVVIRGRPRTHFTLSISGRRIPATPTGLAPDPITIVTGNSGILTATLSPPPAAAGSLSVSSADASIATAPLSVAFAAEQTQVPIPVGAGAVGGTRVTASLNGASVSAAVKVVPPPARIDAIAPASGAAGTLVTLTGAFFDPVPANNRVAFAGADGTPAQAAVIAANASQLTVRVPLLAASGPVTVTNAGGAAQSVGFTLLPLSTRFTVTRAGINAPLTTLSTPVTPFMDGAIPGDSFTLGLLTLPTKGTAFRNGDQLSYRATAALNDVDLFTYRATFADGSARDGTALVKLYNSGNLTACTRTSTLAQRTNVVNCAYYGEVTTRTSATGLPVTVQYIAARPSSGATPKAAVFLIGGGNFELNFIGTAATGQAGTIGPNFLVRTAQMFADAGYLAIAMNGPSDLPAPAVRTNTDSDLYRVSVRHAVDILMVLREVNTDNLDVFLAGTSRGAISAVATNLIGTGIALSSPVTRPAGTGPRWIGDPRHPNLQPGFVQRPSHVLWNTLDECFVTVPADSQKLADDLGAAFDFVTGGLIADPTDQCGSQHYHGFYAIEPDAVGKTTAWLDGRVAALAGNKRPDAAFALLVPAAPGVPLQIDLAALTGDADGDVLSYTLSHVGSGRGGTVTLDGATVTYTPPAGATGGTDNFVYVVTDGRGGVNAAVIRILIGG